MDVALVYDRALDAYDLGPEHPLRPERVSLAVALIEAYGLLGVRGPLHLLAPRPATRAELEAVHDVAYIDTVVRASSAGTLAVAERGIGPGDTPAFPRMHEAASLVAGATLQAIEAVADGSFPRALAPAGGLHHAHRDHAAGFCVYNDVAVGIAAALRRTPGLRVAYIDIDAHHGDGVQEAFWEEPRVLTVSLHEDGRFLFPGTGSVLERGGKLAPGSAVNVPLPPMATDACYLAAFDEVVAPAVGHFAPDLVVAQCGADAHWADPLTSLGMSLGGFEALVQRIVGLAVTHCAGRLVACGGGGYSWLHTVPRAWALVAGALAGVTLPDALPESWVAQTANLAVTAPVSLRADPGPALSADAEAELLALTHDVIATLRSQGL